MRKLNPADSAFNSSDDPLGAQMVHEDYSGSCTRRATVAYDGHIDICDQVRCRNCPSCLRARQFLWQMRAEAETITSHRTFMLTGTWAQQTWDLDEAKREISLFLMRLRSRCHERNTNFRYLVVPERHKSGAFHIHSLIHCLDEVLTYKLIADSWQAGFYNIQHCDFRSAGYVTKYVAKDLFEEVDGKRPRIRSSRAKFLHKPEYGIGPYLVAQPTYGAWVMQKDKELLKQMMAEKPKELLVETWAKNLKMIVRAEAAKPTMEKRAMLMLAAAQKRKLAA